MQSKRVPTYVLPLQVTLTTKTPLKKSMIGIIDQDVFHLHAVQIMKIFGDHYIFSEYQIFNSGAITRSKMLFAIKNSLNKK